VRISIARKTNSNLTFPLRCALIERSGQSHSCNPATILNTRSVEIKLYRMMEILVAGLASSALTFCGAEGRAQRYGEAGATGFVESTVNQVVSKRMVKKQQMRWRKKGAEMLLQVGAQVLNDDLRATFERW
jgi:hypothetical protein